MQIVKLDLNRLTPYSKNAKIHDKEQIESIKESIEKFGMNDPIAVWGESNIIVEGHGRYLALKELGYKDVEVIRLDHLTDDERKAYTLVHNKLNMDTGFDDDLLSESIDEISDIDMTDWGFDFEYIVDDGYYGDERERTNDAYNLPLVDRENLTSDFWEMPIIKNDNHIPNDLIGFNYAKTSKNKNAGIHFYIDDYQFERIWNYPEKYVDILSKYDCILTPDFSLYLDMPMPMKIWNVYRSRFIGAFYQSKGIKVIPTISWAEKETFKFCFQGIQKGSVISISTIGVKQDKEAFKIWKDGMDEMIKSIEPSVIIVYGGEVEYDYGNIRVVYFKNKVTERMGEGGK